MPARTVPGPLRIWANVLIAALPVLSLGVLGMAPSLVLAVRRRRAVDILGAVVIGLMELSLFVAAGLTPKGGKISDAVGFLLLLPMWIGTPVHFLLMNRRRFWPAPTSDPYPYSYPVAPTGPYPTASYPAASYPTVPYPANPYQATAQAAAPHPAPPVAPVVPGPQTGAAELRELGELLRRQAGDGQP